jgi:hypothetical protein
MDDGKELLRFLLEFSVGRGRFNFMFPQVYQLWFPIEFMTGLIIARGCVPNS